MEATKSLKDFMANGTDYSVGQLAKAVGVSRQHLSAVINGKEPLTFRLARDISREMGIDLAVIYERDATE